MSSDVNKLPPYVLLITRVGGVGDRAGAFRPFATKSEAAGAGCGYTGCQHTVSQTTVNELYRNLGPLPPPRHTPWTLSQRRLHTGLRVGRTRLLHELIWGRFGIRLLILHRKVSKDALTRIHPPNTYLRVVVPLRGHPRRRALVVPVPILVVLRGRRHDPRRGLLHRMRVRVVRVVILPAPRRGRLLLVRVPLVALREHVRRLDRRRGRRRGRGRRERRLRGRDPVRSLPRLGRRGRRRLQRARGDIHRARARVDGVRERARVRDDRRRVRHRDRGGCRHDLSVRVRRLRVRVVLDLLLSLVLLDLLLLKNMIRMDWVHHLFARRLGHVLYRRTWLRLLRLRLGMDYRSNSIRANKVRYSKTEDGVKGTTHFSVPVTLQSPKLL